MFVPGAEGVDAYRLLTALVVPRPIAWVSTVSSEGIGNLAPHSSFTVACARPPNIQFTSVGTEDTLRDVLATGEFMVSLATLPMLDSPASLECTMHSTVELGDSTIVLGEVVAITVRSEALEDGHPAMRHLQPLSRLGRNEWELPPGVVAVDRPRGPDAGTQIMPPVVPKGVDLGARSLDAC